MSDLLGGCFVGRLPFSITVRICFRIYLFFDDSNVCDSSIIMDMSIGIGMWTNVCSTFICGGSSWGGRTFMIRNIIILRGHARRTFSRRYDITHDHVKSK